MTEGLQKCLPSNNGEKSGKTGQARNDQDVVITEKIVPNSHWEKIKNVLTNLHASKDVPR